MPGATGKELSAAGTPRAQPAPNQDSLARCIHLSRVKEVDTTLVGDGHQLLGHLRDGHGAE